MKDYFIGVRALENKLAELLAENNLLHVLDHSRYPITLTVTQNQAPDAQMEIWAGADGSTSSRDSVLRFIFHLDDLEIRTSSRLVISDSLMNKIKTQAKKIHAAYVHAYFASTVDQIRAFSRETRHEELEADAETEDFSGFYDDAKEEADDVPDIDVDDIDEAADEFFST